MPVRLTVLARVQRDPAFARSMLDEAATLFLNGDPETAGLILRDLVNATVGFETLGAITDKPSKSLHRMLSRNGNPNMDNIAVIFDVVRNALNVDNAFAARSIARAGSLSLTRNIMNVASSTLLPRSHVILMARVNVPPLNR